MPSALIILNPNADVGNAWRKIADLRALAEQAAADHGYSLDWTGTVYPTHASQLAMQAAERGYNLVIAIGGDGTVHEVVNGLMQIPQGERPRLAVVPLGSGNDFAFSAGIPSEPHKALARAFSGSTRWVDLGIVEDEHGRREFFINTLGIGFDAVVTIRSHSLPAVRGFAMYLTAVLQTILLNHHPIRFRFAADNKEWEDHLLMLVFGNGKREGGGFLVTPAAEIDDGLLNYAALKRVSRPQFLALLPAVMKGRHASSPHVRTGRGKQFTLEADRPLYIHADGEIFAGFGTDVRRLRLSIAPQALEVVA